MSKTTGTARELEKWIVKNGLGEVEGQTGSGHVKYRLINGDLIIGPSTSKSGRTLKNIQSLIRRSLKQSGDWPNGLN